MNPNHARRFDIYRQPNRRSAAAPELEALMGELRGIIRADHASPSGSPPPLRRSEADARAQTGIAHDEA
jgi:hypothetical protein